MFFQLKCFVYFLFINELLLFPSGALNKEGSYFLLYSATYLNIDLVLSQRISCRSLAKIKALNKIYPDAYRVNIKYERSDCAGMFSL